LNWHGSFAPNAHKAVSSIPYQIPQAHFQCGGPRQRVERDVLFRALNYADVFRVEGGQFAQAFLSQPGFEAVVANGLGVRSHAVHQVAQTRIQRGRDSH